MKNLENASDMQKTDTKYIIEFSVYLAANFEPATENTAHKIPARPFIRALAMGRGLISWIGQEAMLPARQTR